MFSSDSLRLYRAGEIIIFYLVNSEEDDTLVTVGQVLKDFSGDEVIRMAGMPSPMATGEYIFSLLVNSGYIKEMDARCLILGPEAVVEIHPLPQSTAFATSA